jgi:polygalacturonase
MLADLTPHSLHLKDSAFWNVHPYASRDVFVRDLLITAPPWAANTDGVDPDSCSNVLRPNLLHETSIDIIPQVLIENIVVRAGDDGVAVKSGLNAAGRAFGMPCEHVTIRNVTVHPLLDNLSTNGKTLALVTNKPKPRNTSPAGISIGSEMSGGVRNVSVDNVTVVGCAAGVYIKSMLGRGG